MVMNVYEIVKFSVFFQLFIFNPSRYCKTKDIKSIILYVKKKR